MTKQELAQLIPKESMIYSKREGKTVQWMYMGRNKDGTYQLCGLPFGYSEDLLLTRFEVVRDKEVQT